MSRFPNPKSISRTQNGSASRSTSPRGLNTGIGTIDFKGDVLTDREELFHTITLRRNDVYSNSAIRRDISLLTELFANQGYAYAEVSPETAVNAKNPDRQPHLRCR